MGLNFHKLHGEHCWRPKQPLQLSFVDTQFLYSFRSATNGQRRPSPFACAVGHASTFVKNASLVTSQWQQHRAWTISLRLTFNAEHEAGQVASTIRQVFSMTRPGIETYRPALVARAQPTSRPGVGNLRPAWKFEMARIRIFVTQFITQHRVKTKLHDKQVFTINIYRQHEHNFAVKCGGAAWCETNIVIWPMQKLRFIYMQIPNLICRGVMEATLITLCPSRWFTY